MIEVSIVCSSPGHPVNPWLQKWVSSVSPQARATIHRDPGDLVGGDVLFLVSCLQIIPKPVRERFQRTFVLHASDLPEGHGMSPHIWQVLEGKSELTVTLLEAQDPVDSGDIWAQRRVRLTGVELYEEINRLIFDAELQLMTWALQHFRTAKGRAQQGEPTYYRKRTPEDSRIDPDRPLMEYFDLLRVADPDRYPAFFEARGARFKIKIEKM